MSVDGHFDVEKSDCRLAGEVRRDGDSLQIQWSLLNRGANPVFLFDGIYRVNGDDMDVSPNLVYVEPAGSQVILGKKLVPVPQGMLVEKKVVPLMSRVLPGERVERSTVVSLPLKLWTPYLSDDPQIEQKTQGLRDTVSGYFEIGLVVTPPEGAALAQPIVIQDRKLWRFDAVSPEHQILMRVGPISGLKLELPANPVKP